MKRLIVLLSCAVFLAGCAVRSAGHPRGLVKPRVANPSVVFGYIDMSAAGGADIDDVLLARLDGEKPQILRGFPDYPDGVTVNGRRPGYFWASDLPPGEYQLAEIAGVGYHGSARTNGGWSRNSFTFDTAKKNASYVKISKPGVYYLGAFKIVNHGKSFDLNEIGSPSEAKALKRLLHRSYDSYWKGMVARRLKQVGG